MSYIGIDLGGTSVKGGVVSAGKVAQKELMPVRQGGSQEEIFSDIVALIAGLWSPEVKGIGFAVPALIHFDAGAMYGVTNIPQLNHFPIQKKLEEKFQVPVRLQNDANCLPSGKSILVRRKAIKTWSVSPREPAPGRASSSTIKFITAPTAAPANLE